MNRTPADPAPEEVPRSAESREIDSAEAVESLRRERDDYYDGLVRKQAEFENYRKRVNREMAEIRIAGRADVLKELLPVLDSCRKGLDALPETERDRKFAAYRQGLELILKNLEFVLEKFGVTEVPGEGETFDPNLHEAVHREITDHRKDGEILEEYRKGYRMKERLLRPSQVKVAVNSQEETSE